MVGSEEKFLKYLDQAVGYEKRKLEAIQKIDKPFDLVETITAVDNF